MEEKVAFSQLTWLFIVLLLFTVTSLFMDAADKNHSKKRRWWYINARGEAGDNAEVKHVESSGLGHMSGAARLDL